MTLALRHAVKFFPSCRGSFVRAKFRSMGIGMKRFFVSAAICLIALQTILLGIAPLASLGSSVVDPFLIICRSEGQPHASDSSNGGSGSHRSSEDCLHCVLCTTCDSATRAVRRHRHRSACKLCTFYSPVPHRTVRWSVSGSILCQRSSAIRYDQLTFQNSNEIGVTLSIV